MKSGNPDAGPHYIIVDPYPIFIIDSMINSPMRKTLPLKKTTLHLFTGFAAVSLMLTTACPLQAAGRHSTVSCPPVPADTNTIHTIQVNKSLNSKKVKIGLYPDARQQVLFFSATGKDKKIYQLYMFDMDGKLVNQASIRNRETTVLTNLSEGNYLFEIFSDDERIENGKLTVR
jgi:hypothetical protein